MLKVAISFHRLPSKSRVVISCGQRIDVNLRVLFCKFKLTDQIHILPSDRRRTPDDLDSIPVAGGQLLLIHSRQDQRVVVDDGVGNEPGTFVPDLLFRFGFYPEFTGIDIGNRSSHTVIRLAAIKRLLNALPEYRVIDEIKDMKRPTNIVQFPERLLGLVLPLITGELTHDGCLSHVFLRKGSQMR